MRLTTIFLLCIPLPGLSVQTKAQDAIFVYGKGTCTAIDIQNVGEIKMTEEVVDISLGVNYRSTDVDSITFREPEVDYGRIGWWGSSADGPSACYYQSFRKDLTASVPQPFTTCRMKSRCFSHVGELAGNGDMSRIRFLVVVSFKSIKSISNKRITIIQKWMKTG